MLSVATAHARSRAYDLFGHLYLHGLTPAWLPILSALPELAGVLPEPFEADEAAADHHHLFGLNIFPYASVFLEEAAHTGGAVTDAARRFFVQGGFAPDLASEGADHVGHALAFLAFLTAAEADALEDGAVEEARRVQDHQRRFLDGYLMTWLPAFTFAVRQQGHSFYDALAGLTLDLVLDHRADLEGERAPAESAPPLADPLEDEKTGLKEVAAYLVTPARAGLFLSRDDIGGLARRAEAPRGFGARALMLTNLLRAAAEYDRAEPLMAELAARVQAWQTFFNELAETGVPGVAAAVQAWQTRVALTASVVARLARAGAGSMDGV